MRERKSSAQRPAQWRCSGKCRYHSATSGNRGRASLSPTKARSVPRLHPQHRGPQGAAGAPREEAGADFPAAAAANSLGCPPQPPLQALGPNPGEPRSPPSRHRGCPGLASKAAPRGRGSESRGGGAVLRGPRQALGCPPCSPLVLTASTAWVGPLRVCPAPPLRAWSHHPVTEALLTAAPHLGERGSR